MAMLTARATDKSTARPRRDRLPAAGNDTVSLAAAIRDLGVTLTTHLTRLDDQITSVLGLLSSPRPGTAPLAVGQAPPSIAVRCLGAFMVNAAGTRIEEWRSSRARALFQYLVTHRGHPIPRETLIQALWPDPDAAAAGTSLKVAVHVLRRVLGEHGIARGQLDIQAHESGYQLVAPELWIDVEEFEHCYTVGRAREARGQHDQALALFTRAAELYQGDFLEESLDDWPMFRREALKDQYLFVVSRLAQQAEARGDYQEAITRCQQILAKDCCREDAYRLLMLCHARLGQRGRVRRWYELCIHTLQTELDCGPEPETENVYRLALSGKV